MDVHFWGTRGSVATPGPRTIRYGGNTSCVTAISDKGTLLVLDCGTGVRDLGDHLLNSCTSAIRGRICLTHTHWDHIQGFPFFAPVFQQGNEFVLYGPADGDRGLEQALAGQMQYTYFPVELSQIGASLSWQDLGEGEFQLDDVHVQCQYLHHPAVTLGYRFTVGGRSLAYCTDHEPFSPTLFKDGSSRAIGDILHGGDRRHAEFVRDVDLLIHDAQYTLEEYTHKRNWGHSTIEYVVDIAIVARVRQLALFHHDPKHDDDTLDQIERHARDLARERGSQLQVFAAREGGEIHLSEQEPDVVGHGVRPPLPSPGASAVSRVLVVDEDPDLRNLILQTLEAENYVLDVARDGEEALQKIRAHHPDLVLLGAQLPSMGGFEVLEHLHDRGDDCPVIMLTGAVDARSTEESFRAGAQDYLAKPFTPSQLRARITEWLSRQPPSDSSAD